MILYTIFYEIFIVMFLEKHGCFVMSQYIILDCTG